MKKEVIKKLKKFIERRMEDTLKTYRDTGIGGHYNIRCRYSNVAYSAIKLKLEEVGEDFEEFKKYIVENECRYYRDRNNNIMVIGYWYATYDIMMELLRIEAEELEVEVIDRLKGYIINERRAIISIITNVSFTLESYAMYNEEYKAFSKIIEDIENLNELEEIRNYIERMNTYYHERKGIECTPENVGRYCAYSKALKFLKVIL